MLESESVNVEDILRIGLLRIKGCEHKELALLLLLLRRQRWKMRSIHEIDCCFLFSILFVYFVVIVIMRACIVFMCVLFFFDKLVPSKFVHKIQSKMPSQTPNAK